MKTLKNTFMAAVVIITLGSSNAYARGFIGGLIEDACGGCGVGEKLDDLNDQYDHPVEHAISTAVSVYASPSAGAALEAGWEMQRQIQNAQSTNYQPQPQYNDGYYQQPAYQQQYYNGYYQQPVYPTPNYYYGGY